MKGGKTKAGGSSAGGKKNEGGEEKKTNLFHPPCRVQTDSILDLGRFQGESVRHVHTQHCHVSGRLPPLTAACLSAVSAALCGCHGRYLAAGQLSCWVVVFFSWSGKRRSEVELLLLLQQEASAAL